MKKEVIIVILALLCIGCTTKFPEAVTGQFRDPIAPCFDSGHNVYTAGWARDYYLIYYDYCLDEKILYEAVCINVQMAGHAPYSCEKGCFNRACKQ